MFVTGGSQGQTNGEDYATVAYRAATGRQLWARRYHAYYGAAAAAVSPEGTAVYVTGGAHGSYATVAYRAGTGRQRWASRYSGPGGARACCVAVSPAGTTVFVTGDSESRTSADYATVAYRS